MSHHQLDAIELSKAVKERLVDFALDDCFVNDAKLTEICKTIWTGEPEQGGLISDLWIEGAFPAKNSTNSLDSLSKDKKFNKELCNHLDKNQAVPKTRFLYSHQSQAILAAQETYPNNAKPALVVTAGTGAGKTESFLLPILNDLFNQTYSVENENQGIKCLILYPMNALVNDQVERLYEWLKGQKRLTLFHFTSETPENKEKADKESVPEYDTSRMRTREEARGRETRDGKKIENGRIPNILVTNYSMLEYMLCRPQDAVFFGQNLRAIVLDEAHLYTGTLAAEITSLLRRVYQRCSIDPNQILQVATSATMGGKKDNALRDFAATLFTKRTNLVKVIIGEQARVKFPGAKEPNQPLDVNTIVGCQWLYTATFEYNLDTPSLSKNEAQCDSLRKELPLLVAKEIIKSTQTIQQPAKLLYEALQYAPFIQQIEAILWKKKRLKLHELAKELWKQDDDNAVKATTILLQMGAAARKTIGEYPLLPHRIHLLARPTDGLTVCLNPECTGDAKLKLDNLGCVSTGYHDKCPYCQSAMLSVYRCTECGEWILVGIEKEDHNYLLSPMSPIIPDNFNGIEDIRYYTLKRQPLNHFGINRQTGEIGGITSQCLTVYNLVNSGERTCPNCGETGTNKKNTEPFKPFIISNLALSVIAETALSQLPVFPSKQSNEYLPANGRRMLLFSDSRREAAKLGPTLTRQHEMQVVRSAITECVQKSLVADDEVVKDLQNSIKQLEKELHSPKLTPALRQSKKKHLDQRQRELKDAQAGGSLEDWANSLQNIEATKQLLHFESSEQHNATKWWGDNPDQWTQNFSKLKGDFKLKGELFFLLKQELARYFVGAASLEAFGLVEVTFPGLNELKVPDSFLGTLRTSKSRDELKKCWASLLVALCHSLRNDGCVTMSEDEKRDDEYQFKGARIGKWCSLENRGYFLTNFVPIKKIKETEPRRYRFVKKVLQQCGLPNPSEPEVKGLLEAVFKQLLENKTITWLEKTKKLTHDQKSVDAIRIILPNLGLRRPQALYRCPITHRVFTYSVLGCAVESSSKQDLESVTEEQLDGDPRIGRQRREYQDSPVFKMALWAEEHSAQLSPKENRRLQDLFKAGMRNILSSTTTLELGIDIGGLHAVLMSNVPPGKTNYLQRAGRAGRRADGSSIVITYCRSSPFDRAVFLRFGEYLARELREPKIFLDRKRILKRHANAFLLGEFFRELYSPDDRTGTMEAYGKMGSFCGVALLPFDYWKKGSNKPTLEKPKEGLDTKFLNFLQNSGNNRFAKVIKEFFSGNPELQELFDWSNFIEETQQDFSKIVDNWKKEYQTLLGTWQEKSVDEIQAANAIHYKLLSLRQSTVIEALAEEQFLPRYGFPIGVMKLSVFEYDEPKKKVVEREDQYRLERPGLLALGEYVPGSQLLVGGKLITSHGLLKHWTGTTMNNIAPDLRGRYTICENEHFFYEITEEIGKCPICGANPRQTLKDFIIPKHGFRTAVWDEPKRSSDIERVGSVDQGTVTFVRNPEGTEEKQENFADIKNLFAHYKENGELLVYNEGDNDLGFAICLKCGYADSEKDVGNGRMKLPSGFEKHVALDKKLEKPCWKKDETFVLRNQTLAAKQTTDVLLLDFGSWLQHKDAFGIVATLAHALKIVGAELLELDSRELGALVTGTKQGWGAVIYDNVPGGAGHVLELFKFGRKWLEAAKQQMYIGEKHHEQCETACLDCLLAFDTQNAMIHGQLQRRKAYEILENLKI